MVSWANAERSVYRKQFYQLDVPLYADLMLQLVRQTPTGLLATMQNELTGKTIEFEIDQVIVERGTLPLTEVYDSLRQQSTNGGIIDIDTLVASKPQPGIDSDGYALYRIGDAVSCRSLHAALLDAYRLTAAL